MTQLILELPKKLCLFCKYFYLETGQPYYSNYTPGADAAMGCNKHIIEIDLNWDTLDEYRQKIMTAGTWVALQRLPDRILMIVAG